MMQEPVGNIPNASRSGIRQCRFDLIAGFRQTLDAWEQNAEQAIAMSPEHMSLYLLEIHEGTPLAEQVRNRQPYPRP
ncbi:MAG: hypothetical protein IPK98_09670 [Chloracidobacterium sp.]|nr:hypothetical protein [Chloracidobacterium sp.]